jgi:hypothetical protein
MRALNRTVVEKDGTTRSNREGSALGSRLGSDPAKIELLASRTMRDEFAAWLLLMNAAGSLR